MYGMPEHALIVNSSLIAICGDPDLRDKDTSVLRITWSIAMPKSSHLPMSPAKGLAEKRCESKEHHLKIMQEGGQSAMF